MTAAVTRRQHNEAQGATNGGVVPHLREYGR
jgi:hypothetical protein